MTFVFCWCRSTQPHGITRRKNRAVGARVDQQASMCDNGGNGCEQRLVEALTKTDSGGT